METATRYPYAILQHRLFILYPPSASAAEYQQRQRAFGFMFISQIFTREGFDPSQQVYQRERAASGRSCSLHGETAFLPRGDDAANKRRIINMYIAISRSFGSRSRPEYISHKDVSLSKGFVKYMSCHGQRIIPLRSLFCHCRVPARPAKPQGNGLSISLHFCVLYHGL